MFEAARDHLQHGRHEQAQPLARRQITLEPWREPAHRQLMLAYALAGDRANALAQYEASRAVLQEELGAEPSAETTALLQEIKRGRYAGTAGESLPAPARFQHNLPASTTPLVGRELDMERVSHLILEEKQRLVTIAGPGGMGKTRLALAVGAFLLQDFSDGVFFVDLSSAQEAAEIIPAIADALAYQAPDPLAPLAPQLLAMLSRRHLLLVLDNFEHLLAGAPLLNEILQSCPRLSLLVTSRQRLNLASESRYELSGLDFPVSPSPQDALAYTAVQLFTDSGRRARAHFELTVDNVDEVIRICRLVQGMPLGLLLAAAWLDLLTPGEIADEIEESLDFLAADLADLPPRQRSMQALFQRSWSMLSSTEQEVLAKLSVFRRGFTRQAAEEVAGANLRILLSLANNSLLQRHTDQGRFTMHELLRQFAVERRRQADPSGTIERAHCAYFARLVAEETRRFLYMYPIHLPTSYATDAGNILRAWQFALQQGLPEALADMAAGMMAFAYDAGTDTATVPEQALVALEARGLPEEHPVMRRLQLLRIFAGYGRLNYEDVRRRLEALLPVLEAEEVPELSYHVYAGFAHDSEDGEASLTWDRQARQAALRTGDPLLIRWAEADSLTLLVWHRKEHEGLSGQLREALAHFESHFPSSFPVFALTDALSMRHERLGEFEAALAYGRRSLNIAKAWRDLYWISIGADRVADVHASMGREKEARLQHLDALEWHLAIGQVWQTLGFMWAKCTWMSSLLGDLAQVVAILSMVHHHPEATQFHRQQTAESRARFEPQMGEKAFEEAWDEGRTMSYETAVQLMRDMLLRP
jgi:hypothetical protein